MGRPGRRCVRWGARGSPGAGPVARMASPGALLAALVLRPPGPGGRAGPARLRARAPDTGRARRRGADRGRGVRGRPIPPRTPTAGGSGATRSCSGRRATPTSTSSTACISASTSSACPRARPRRCCCGPAHRGGGPVAWLRRPAARADTDLARGPARLCQALAIDRALDGADVCAAGSPLRMRGRHRGGPFPRAGADRAPGRRQLGRRRALAVLDRRRPHRFRLPAVRAAPARETRNGYRPTR